MDKSELLAKKQELVAIAARAYRENLQTNTGGNLSVRLESVAACVIKPSGVGFAECSVDNLMVVGLDGTILEGTLKPSKDLGFHLEIYRIRSEVKAIVHVHSAWATGWASAGREVPCVTIHSKAKLKKIPVVPTAPGGGPQTEQQVGEIFKDTAIIAAVFADHGSIGVAKSLLSALHIVELIEETAHIATVRAIVSNRSG